MSQFFDQASLVMVPSGYKNGKVYSQKPLSADGELTFTRASNASRVNADGLIEKVRTNLLTYSNDFSNAAWSKINNVSVSATRVADPFGGTTAWQIIYDGTTDGRLEQTVSGFSGTGTQSVWLRVASGTQDVKIGATSGLLTTSVVTTTWTRFSGTTASGNFPRILCNASTTIEVYSCQFEAGDIATDYIETTTAAVSVGPVSGLPRLDYSGGCPSLLLEPSATALNQFSESFDNAYWTQNGTTTTANQIVSPDGYTNADLVAATSGIGNRVERTGFSLSGSHTFSIFLKKGTSTRSLWYDSNKGVQIDWAADGTPTVTGFSGGAPASFGSVDYGNGWYRVWFQDTYSFTRSVQLFPDRIGTTGTVYAWGANLTQTSYLQSYIPTLGSAVTRLADSAYKTGISSLIGQTEGTLFVDFDFTNISGVQVVFSIHDSANNKRLEIWANNNALNGFIGGSVNITVGSSNITNGRHKAALAYKQSGDHAFYIDGVQIGTNSTAYTIAALTTLIYDYWGTGIQPTAGVRQTLLFKTRLTNAQLAELTAL
jgi:hypothetical protein